MTQPSVRQQLIDHLLDGGLDDFIAEGISAGKGWRELAEEIESRTKVRVSRETLRLWFADRITIEVKVA